MSKHSSENSKASSSEIHKPPSKMEELSKKIDSSIMELFKKIHIYENTKASFSKIHEHPPEMKASSSEIHEHPPEMERQIMELIKKHSSEHTRASPSEIAEHPSTMDEELLKGEIMKLFKEIDSSMKLFKKKSFNKILEHSSKMKEVSEFIGKIDSYARIKELFEKICIDREEIKNCILSRAERGDWQSFKKDFIKKPGLIKTALNKWKQTALHIAIAAGEDKIAKELLELAHDREALYKKDCRGDTALHLAAALGMTDVCQKIIGVSPRLFFNQNEKEETPIFLAAAHGYAETFDILLKSKPLPENRAVDYRKRKDGNTMLHCAIANDKFEFALLVLKLYPSLATVYNSAGYTPLHILARKPTAFKSGTPLGTIERLFYWSLPVKNTPSDEEYAEDKKIGLLVKNTPSDEEYAEDKKIGLSVKNTPSDEEYAEDKKIGRGKRVLSALASAASIVATSLADYFYGEKLKNMKQKHMLVEEIMVKLVNVKSWSTYHFEGKHLRFPFHYERTMLWAIPKLPVSDSSVSGPKSMLPSGVMATPSSPEPSRPPSLELLPPRPPSLPPRHAAPLPVPAPAPPKKVPLPPRPESAPEPPQVFYMEGEPIKNQISIGETPFLVAARMGVIEMVKAIYRKFNNDIFDKGEFKNALLLAVENRQINVCDFLIKSVSGRKSSWKDVRKMQDINRNNPLHLAADQSYIMQPWCIHGGIMKMLWEINWYQYVKDSFPFNFTEARNSDGKTPSEVFQDKHKVQMRGVEGGNLVTQASQYCSVIASLIATVAFTSATTFPGGNNEQGLPNFKGSLAFQLYMIFAILALCFSLMSLFIFLDLIFSPYQDPHGFNIRLMRKLALGLICLFSSIVEMLISFFAGHFLIQTKAKLSPPLLVGWYCFASLLLFIIFILQFHSYPRLVLSVFRGKPEPWYRMDNIL